MVLVPALAVDRSGARLGQGGGYYDRMLAELASLAQAARHLGSGTAARASAEQVRIVAVVHDEELLPAGAVPREGHDQLMMAVLTPTRFVPLDPGGPRTRDGSQAGT
jgi:5-formyltetrahydrofolate cyclo-ligase